VLAVSFSRPDKVAAYVARYPFPFPVVADPDRVAYRAFELGRTTWRDMMRGRVLGRYLQLIWQKGLPRKRHAGEDLLQLGGDFVLDGRRRVVYAYRSADPTDRPDPADLVQAVKAAVGTAGQEAANHGSRSP
jgi:peroxiredoxin